MADQRADPEQIIRRYLDDHGGEVDATVHHLLVSFHVEPDDESGRALIRRRLSQAGITVEPPIAGLEPDQAIRLSVLPAASAPARPGKLAARWRAYKPRSRRGWAIAGLAVAGLAAAVTGAGLALSSGDSGHQPRRAEPAASGQAQSEQDRGRVRERSARQSRHLRLVREHARARRKRAARRQRLERQGTRTATTPSSQARPGQGRNGPAEPSR